MIIQLVIYYILLNSKKNYKLIAIDLTKQTELKDLQQVSFIGKLEKDDGTTTFLTSFNFSPNSVTII